MLPSRVQQYLFSECLATPLAFVMVWMCHSLQLPAAQAAVVASIGDCLGFYAFLAYLDVRKSKQIGYARYIRVFRALFAEFALAEMLDTCLLSPALMWLAQTVLAECGIEPSLGLLVGKYVSDIFFFLVSYISHVARGRGNNRQEVEA